MSNLPYCSAGPEPADTTRTQHQPAGSRWTVRGARRVKFRVKFIQVLASCVASHSSRLLLGVGWPHGQSTLALVESAGYA